MNRERTESILWDIAAIGFGLISGVAIIAIMNQINMFFYPINSESVVPAADPDLIAFQDPIFLSGRLISIATGAFFAGALSHWVRSGLTINYNIITGCILLLVGIIDLTMFPYPAWFIVISVISYIPMTLSGHLFVQKIIHNL